MSFLENVTKGKKIGPQIHTIFGSNGIGKTTWAASFPSVLILDLEKGSDHLDVSRISSEKLKTLEDFRKVLKELISSKHSFETITIDSLESLEGLISDSVCLEGKVKSIELYDGGYGKGYVRSREIMRELFEDFRALQSKGMTIILVAHTQTKAHTDPTNNVSYDRIVMRVNDKLGSLVKDLSDSVFFVTYKVLTITENKKTKAFGDGQRVMYTAWRPSFDAKNRLNLPFEIPFSYDSFIEACKAGSEVNTSSILAELNEMATLIKDPNVKKAVSENLLKFKDNPSKLLQIKNQLITRLDA